LFGRTIPDKEAKEVKEDGLDGAEGEFDLLIEVTKVRM
jgi:hypothetical protein